MMVLQTRTWALAAASGFLILSGLAPASAQIVQPWTDRVFVHVSGGEQTKARSYTVAGDFPLYGEAVTWDASMANGSASIVDAGGGIRLFHNLGAALAFSRYADSHASPIAGTVPDPLFFDQPHASALELTGLTHRERGVHLSATFTLPVTEQLEVMLLAGPSFFSLRKDVVSDVTVGAGGTTLASASARRISASSTGGHVGADISYLVWRGPYGVRLGAGVFLRHSSGSVDVDAVDGGRVEVGGFNYGAGLRLRY